DAADFSLLALPVTAQNRTEQELLNVAAGIPGGVRFEPESW
ncbi:phage tail assembly protein T, partial [Salmonella enterica]|nr:phage tail assembly protein T [Salmonella enterica]